MTDETPDAQAETGSGLRKKYTSLRRAYVDDLCGRHGLDVKELGGVADEELGTRASEIAAERAAERQQMLRTALLDSGIPEDQLDSALDRLATGSVQPAADGETPTRTRRPPDTAAGRIASLGQLGQPSATALAGSKAPRDDLFGRDRILAARGTRRGEGTAVMDGDDFASYVEFRDALVTAAHKHAPGCEPAELALRMDENVMGEEWAAERRLMERVANDSLTATSAATVVTSLMGSLVSEELWLEAESTPDGHGLREALVAQCCQAFATFLDLA